MKYNIGKICDINKQSLSVKDSLPQILYLDTSSIVKNQISECQVIDVSNIPSRAKRKVEHNTIIYSTVRPNQEHYGIMENPLYNLIVSTGFVTIDIKERFKDTINPYYLYYSLTQSYVTDYLSKKAASAVSAYPSIVPKDIENLSFSIPEYNEQNKIVDIISHIDRKIENCKKINQELESTIKDIYDYWFVQFDFPNEEGKPYKSSGGEMVWNETLKREVPKGWEVVNIKDIAKIDRGDIITAENAISGNIKVVAAGVDYSYTHNQSNRGPNVITISSSGANAGYINFWRESIYASDCITVQCDQDIDTIFLHQMMRYYQKRLNQLTSGSAQPHIYPYDIEALPMIKIPIQYKEKISKEILSINKRIGNCSKEQEYLQSLRDFLLPMLMNGQIKIKD